MHKLPGFSAVKPLETVSYQLEDLLHPLEPQAVSAIAKDSVHFKYNKKDKTLPKHATHLVCNTLSDSVKVFGGSVVAIYGGAAGILYTVFGLPLLKNGLNSTGRILRRPLIKKNKGVYKLLPGETGKVTKVYRKKESAYADVVKDIHITLQQRDKIVNGLQREEQSLPYAVSSFVCYKSFRWGVKSKPAKETLRTFEWERVQNKLHSSIQKCQKFYREHPDLEYRLLSKHPEYQSILKTELSTPVKM